MGGVDNPLLSWRRQQAGQHTRTIEKLDLAEGDRLRIESLEAKNKNLGEIAGELSYALEQMYEQMQAMEARHCGFMEGIIDAAKDDMKKQAG